jgi:hypothetical protein
MPDHIKSVTTFDPTAFAHFIDWGQNPTEGVLAPDHRYNSRTCQYARPDITAVLSIDRAVFYTTCSANFFNGDFAQNANVVLGDNIGSNLPIHVTFRVGDVTKIGMHISAVTVPGTQYFRQLGVRARGRKQWQTFTVKARISSSRGTAAFLGAEALPGEFIEEFWVDVVNVPGGSADIRQVAIGDLYFS